MDLAFKNDTNWCVITGAPSSGKTSVIEELARRGFPIQNEVARELIEFGMHHGKSLEDVRKNAALLQRKILQVTLAREMGLDTKKTVFLDRGLPDSITYFKLAGLDGLEAKAMSYLFRYRAVFIFDRLPLVKDGVRTESTTQAENIDKMLEEDYRAMGYDPIRVPVMPVEARADFVMEKIGSRAGRQ